ncbi:MAG: TIGR02452 family protein [Lachnospiraceae bacterium]
MDRKAMAKETLNIMKQGYYEPAIKNKVGQKLEKKQMIIKDAMEQSVERSVLITPEEGEKILEKYHIYTSCSKPETRVENISTVKAIRMLMEEGKTDIGVLNFASAKNPGGGFLNGAKAQEESLTVSSTLYPTLTAHEEYYRENRAHKSMMYLDYAIYSPEVVFFRDERFRLAETPVKASVLTLPAVNMGQVLLKGENVLEAKRMMRRRMKLALGIFAEQKAKHLVLGAYGCGVFRNDPKDVAIWWRELMEEGMGQYFDSVFYAVLDHSKEECCIKAFQE